MAAIDDGQSATGDGMPADAEETQVPLATAANGRTALLIDWGGVLTTNLFGLLPRLTACSSQIDPQAIVKRFRENRECRELLIALEKGSAGRGRLSSRASPRILGVEPAGLVDGLFAGVGPDEAMIDAVRRARQAGVRTAPR